MFKNATSPDSSSSKCDDDLPNFGPNLKLKDYDSHSAEPEEEENANRVSEKTTKSSTSSERTIEVKIFVSDMEQAVSTGLSIE